MDAPNPAQAMRQRVVAGYRDLALDHDPSVLVATALRTKSPYLREVLADAAWRGQTPMDIFTWSTGAAPQIAADMDVAWLARFAQVVALQAIESDAQQLGRGVLEAITRAGRLPELPRHLAELLLQLRLAARDSEAAAQLLDEAAVRPAQRAAVRADLLNPHLFPADADEDGWLEAFNEALQSPGVVGVALRDGAASPFDRLSSTPTAPVTGPQPCVTLIMSCYQPDESLFTAVRSVLEQTWQNFELIVVDDASGPEFKERFARLERMDHRIRLVRKAINGGTYRARNTALRLAVGEFCTVVDSDDWLHPQALERHVQPLLAEPRLMGTISRAVRVTEDLELNRPGTLPRVPSAASLMFRSQEVLARIGFFDTTSKGADTEFRRRLEIAFGVPVRELPEVLSVLRTGDTLSSAEISRGWKHPARRAYRKGYEAWHEEIAEGVASPFMDPGEERRFPEPRRWAKPSSAALGRDTNLDVCVVADWSRTARHQKPVPAALRTALAAGLRVAIMHVDDIRCMARRDNPIDASVMSLLREGAVEWVYPDDDVDVELVVIEDPAVMQYPPATQRRLHASRVVVTALPEREEPTSVPAYAATDVVARTSQLLGAEPEWLGSTADELIVSLLTGGSTVPARRPSHGSAAPRLSPESADHALGDLVVHVEIDRGRLDTEAMVTVAETLSAEYAVHTTRLRSAADAERHESITVVSHRDVDDGVRAWLRRLDSTPTSCLESDECFASVPPGVLLVVAVREGECRLLSRLPLSRETDEASQAGTAERGVPAPWSTTVWWRPAHARHVGLGVHSGGKQG